jgi:hypothetical protein
MVFSANAIESGPNNFASFQAKAMQINGTNSATGAIRLGSKQSWLMSALGAMIAGIAVLV